MCRNLGRIERGSKFALVTGASTGIGRCYVEQLAELGYNLIVVSRTETTLNEVAKAVEGMKIVKTILVKNRLVNLIVKPQ